MRARACAALAVLIAPIVVAVAGGCASFSSTDDAPVDASRPRDANDASPNDANATDARAPCPTAAFCDDFERPSSPAQGWDEQDESGGILQLVPDDRPTGGTSLLTVISAAATDGRQVLLRHKLGGARDRARVAFSFHVLTPPDNDVLITQFLMTNSGVVFVILRGDKLFMTEQSDAPADAGGGDNEAVPISPILGAAWHRVVFAYVSTPTKKLVASVDGVTPASELDVKFATGQIQGVEIGSTFARAGTAARLAFDDVVIEDAF